MKLLEWLSKLLDEDKESADAVRARWKTEGIKTKIIIMLAYAQAIIDAIRATDGNSKTWTMLVSGIFVGSMLGGTMFALSKIYYWGREPGTMITTKDIVFTIALGVSILLAQWLGIASEKRSLRVLFRPVEEKTKILESMNKELIDSYNEILSKAREANERAHEVAEVAEEATQLAGRSLSQSDKLEEIAKTAIEQRNAERELNKKLGMKKGGYPGAGRPRKWDRWAQRITQIGEQNTYAEYITSENIEDTPENWKRFKDGTRNWVAK